MSELVEVSINDIKLYCIKHCKIKIVIAAGRPRDMMVFCGSLLMCPSVDNISESASFLSGLGILKHINTDKLYAGRTITLYNGKITDNGVKTSILEWLTKNGLN